MFSQVENHWAIQWAEPLTPTSEGHGQCVVPGTYTGRRRLRLLSEGSKGGATAGGRVMCPGLGEGK